MDGGPATNRRAVHPEALFKRLFGQLPNGIRNVVLQSRQVGKSQVEHLDVIFLDKLQHSLRISHESLLICMQDGLHRNGKWSSTHNRNLTLDRWTHVRM